MKRSLLPLMALALVGGCSTLPGDGPSGRTVADNAGHDLKAVNYAMVDVDFAVRHPESFRKITDIVTT